ncbi:MAG: hypothetical protein AAFR65_14510 [Pseudomonadota bacterium]
MIGPGGTTSTMRMGITLAVSCAALAASAAANDETAEEDVSTPLTEATAPEEDIVVDGDLPPEAEDTGGPRDRAKDRRAQRKAERAALRASMEAYGADASRWRFATAVAFANAEVDLTSVEVDVPDDFLIEDLDVVVTDLTDISSTAWINTVAYRVLPFLEVSGQIGVLQSETVTAFEITGTPDLELITFDEPITLQLDAGEEADGYTFGLGTNAIAPVGIVAGRPLIGVAGFRYNWNRVDNGNINSESLFANFGLAYAVPTEQALYSFSLGAGYGRLERESIRDASFGGENIRVRVEQELENPWSVDFGVSRSLGPNWRIGYALSNNLSGPSTHLIALSFSPNEM